VSGNIQAFDFGDDASAYVAHVIDDFFRDYGGVRLLNGAPARLALYFPQNDDLDALRPAIETALLAAGESPAVCLRNTSESTKDEVDAFNRLNDPAAPHRVILLVNKGTEGWNCPSLFACALARRLRSSNNFVLQAATRCLRQVPGNLVKARIYLSRDNRAILDRQLQETYGESIADLQQATRERGAARLVLRKRNRPPLVLTRLVRTVVPATRPAAALRFAPPVVEGTSGRLEKSVLELVPAAGLRRILQQVGDTVSIETAPAGVDRYEAAVSLVSASRVDLWALLDELDRLYPGGQDVPVAHLDDLARQLADQTRAYEVREERVEWALALVRPDGFDRSTGAGGEELYTAEITYPKDREKLLLRAEDLREQNLRGFGFHYDPYNFDSSPEAECFRLLLRELNLHPDDVEDVYFTGGLTDPAKTDFRVEYLGEDGRPHGYTPDFVIRKRPLKGGRPGSGRVLVVEVKDARWEAPVREDEARWARGEVPLTTEGRKAVALRRLEGLDPDRLRYEMVFVRDVLGADQLSGAYRFIREPESAYETDRQVAERLKELVLQSEGDRVRRIILFGSRARGDARPDSDYDLLVVMGDLTREEHKERLLALYRAFEGVGVVAEPWIMSETYFEETKEVIGGLAYPANKEGMMLYARP
jgi:predicted nucleotidyltransferase